jgi:two-component system, LuxR family, sensor kinase FixL
MASWAKSLWVRATRWQEDTRQQRDDRAFAAQGLLQQQRGMQILCLFAFALLVVSAIGSYVSEREQFLILLRIRLAGAAALAIIFTLLGTRYGAPWSRVLGLAFVAAMSVMIFSLAQYTGGQASVQNDRMTLIILGLAVLATWSASWATLACVLVLSVYVVGSAATTGLAVEGVAQHLGRMITASAVTVGAALIRERLRWQAFCAHRALSDTDARWRDSEQRYALLMETAGSAIIVLARDQRIVEFNREAEILYGRTRREVLGRRYSELFLPPRLHAGFAATIDGVLAGTPIRAIEQGVRSRAGVRRELLWNITRVDGDGRPVGIIAVGQDITERKRAEEEVQRLNAELEERVQARSAELRASEERFRTIFESAPIGIMTADRDGCVRNTNRALRAMLGYSAEQLQQKTLDELTAEPDRMRSRSAFRQLCAGEGTELLIDKRYVRRDGDTVWAHEAFAVVRDQHGEFAYVLAMVEDVTERQRAEERARRHQEQLAHVLRVSTMGEMAAELAHELNQPLGAIVNFANGTLVRLRARGTDPDIENAVAQIAAEGLRAGEVIRRIRDFVRQGDSHREPSDVNHLVRQAAHLVEADARGRGIPMRLVLDPDLPAIAVDRIQVEQLILNLLRNAIDAIVAGPHGDDEVLVQTARTADAGVEVTVRDTGIGLSPEAAPRMFDAFFTTKDGGLGMGLSISRSIVEAHGGRLWAAENGDRGATFTFSLPHCAAD